MKLWKACSSRDDARTELEYVYFENGYAYASNAHILAKINLKTLTTFDDEEISCLNGYCIHANALKLLAHYDNISIGWADDDTLTLVCEIRKNKLTLNLTKKEEINAPDFESVLKTEGEKEPIEKIGIEKTYIGDLTDAIGAKRVKFDFYGSCSKIIVTPIDDLFDVKGLIMPIMVTGSLDFGDDTTENEDAD